MWSGKCWVLKAWTAEWTVWRRNVEFIVLIPECRACHVAYEVCSVEREREREILLQRVFGQFRPGDGGLSIEMCGV